MNLFLGVEIPENIRKKISKQIGPLRTTYPDFSWVPEENYHITVQHFGDIDESKVPRLVTYLDRHLFDINVTHLYSFAVNLFISKQIFLYISFRKDNVLSQINERCAEWEAQHGRESKGKYLGRCSIGKYKIPSKQQYFHLKKRLTEYDIDIDFRVEEVFLFQSITHPKHPIYNKIKTFHLVDDR